MSPRSLKLVEVSSPDYRGPDRRSGKHSPYGDELFRIMRAFNQRQEVIVADITALQDAIDKLGSDATADHDRIVTAVETLDATVTDLQNQIAALSSGSINQATIDALTVTVGTVDDQLGALADSIAPTVVTPPPTAS